MAETSTAIVLLRDQPIVRDRAKLAGVDPQTLIDTVRMNVMQGRGTDADLALFLATARRYDLDPLAGQIFAIEAKDENGRKFFRPYVGYDGYIILTERNPQYDGCTFVYYEDEGGRLLSVECSIYRKDRKHPTTVREFNIECNNGKGPWKSHQRRRLREVAFVQAARLAFGITTATGEDAPEMIEGVATVISDHDVLPPSSRTEVLTNLLVATSPGAESVPLTQTHAGAAEATDGEIIEAEVSELDAVCAQFAGVVTVSGKSATAEDIKAKAIARGAIAKKDPVAIVRDWIDKANTMAASAAKEANVSG